MYFPLAVFAMSIHLLTLEIIVSSPGSQRVVSPTQMSSTYNTLGAEGRVENPESGLRPISTRCPGQTERDYKMPDCLWNGMLLH